MIGNLCDNPWKVLKVDVASVASWAGASAACRCPVSASPMPRLFSDMARAGSLGVGLREWTKQVGHHRSDGGAEHRIAYRDLGHLVQRRIRGLPECLRVFLPEAQQAIPKRAGLRQGRRQDRRGLRGRG